MYVSGGLFRSYDGGRTFARVLVKGETLPLVTPSGDLLAWFEVVGYGLCRTSNGQDWTCGDYILDANGQPADGIFPRFFERARPGGPIPETRLLADGRGGPAYSDDDGLTWQPSDIMVAITGIGDALAVLDGGPLHGVAVGCHALPSGPSGWRIHQSANGIHWTDVGPAPNSTVTGRDPVSLVAVPGGLLAAYATYDTYVWLSGDGGRSWRAVTDLDGEADTTDRITDVEVGPDGRLYASVVSVSSDFDQERGGIYRTVDPVFVVATAPEGPPASSLAVSVRPNPSSGRAAIAVDLAASSSVRVVVLDAVGREVALLHDGAASGTLALSLDTSGLAPGVYTVRATAGTETATTRLTVAR